MTTEEKSFIQTIWENRFIKSIVPYVIGAWGVIQVSDFLESRYTWAKGLPDFILIFALVMLPAVFVFSYYRGSHTGKLAKAEKIFIPINFVLAILLGYFGLGSGDATNIASKISVVDEEGQTIERVVPNSTDVKRVVLIPWEAKDQSSDEKWLGFALPMMLSSDLEQDIRVISISPSDQAYAYEEYGLTLDKTPPFSIQRKIASDKYSDYFMTGSFEKEGDIYKIETSLISTDNGKEVYSKNYENTDPLQIVDDISEDFRSEIYVENELDEKFIDLPASNLYTSSLPALKNYTESIQAFNFNKNYPLALEKAKAATELDPNFAWAYSSLSYYNLSMNKDTEAKTAIKKAMDLKDALSERMQFLIKYYYLRMGNLEKSNALLEMWSQLYPKDYKPYSNLISFYQRSGQSEKAKQYALLAYKNGHTGPLLLTLASLESAQGNYEKAESYYDEFEKRYPYKATKVVGKGRIYLAQGQLDKAQKYFEKLLVLEPDKSIHLRSLAEIAGRRGNFEEELKILDHALANEKHLQDSISTMQQKERVYLTRGQVDRYFSEVENRWNTLSKILPIAQQKVELWYPHNMDALIDQGRSGILEELMKSVQGMDNSVVDYRCILKINYYAYANEKESLNKVMEECGEMLSNFADQTQRDGIYIAIESVNENYDKAIEYAQKYKTATKQNISDFGFMGEIYRLNKDFENAEKYLNATLKERPSQPKYIYELALTYHEQGKIAEAKTTLQKALNIWKDADAHYKPAILAKEKMAEWE